MVTKINRVHILWQIRSSFECTHTKSTTPDVIQIESLIKKLYIRSKVGN